jgi:hypothetical protein
VTCKFETHSGSQTWGSEAEFLEDYEIRVGGSLTRRYLDLIPDKFREAKPSPSPFCPLCKGEMMFSSVSGGAFNWNCGMKLDDEVWRGMLEERRRRDKRKEQARAEFSMLQGGR